MLGSQLALLVMLQQSLEETVKLSEAPHRCTSTTDGGVTVTRRVRTATISGNIRIASSVSDFEL